ncbi:MAG: SigB/SigF/SigG family RNA polymerase sigma factor [Clostridia bacterium]|nr:SigB/SigF/SigG family RNA polymerase sigma factor [Clostridia bacterium]
MRTNKVEICGVDTSLLKTLTEDEKRDLLKRSREGDKEARERLIMGNLRLVLSVSGRFNPKRDSADDLFQVGCIGLIKAIDNFNPDFDVKFSTYAVPMIIGELRRYQRDNNAVRVSRGVRDLAYRALQAKEEITRTEGREATIPELARKLETTERAISEAMEAIIEPISLFDSVFGEGEDKMYVIDKLADEDDTDEVWIENINLKEALKKLGERELNIIKLRYYKGKTQMEIADEIGISQAQVSRLEKGAIDKLKKYMA